MVELSRAGSSWVFLVKQRTKYQGVLNRQGSQKTVDLKHRRKCICQENRN